MEERFLTLRDGHRLFFRVWRSEGECRAALHLLHGMAEHSLRYDAFARALNSIGITVYAQDHRGHGLTKEEDEKGWFAYENGWMTIAADSWQLDQVIMEENPDVPHFLMGHSMGSFLARTVATEHPTSFDALVIMGSGASKGLLGKVGKCLARRHVKKYGSKMPDPKLDKLSFGSYNRKVGNKRTDFDWLSRDEAEVDKYIADPLCGFICSSQFFADIIDGIEIANDTSRMRKLKKSMPVLIISGDADPVGGYGKGINKIYRLYRKAGLENVTLKLVPGGRHELLNETDRNDTTQFLASWLDKQIGAYDA